MGVQELSASYSLGLKFERSEKFERSKIRVGSPGLKNPEASKFLGRALGNVGHLRRALLPEQRKIIIDS